MKNTIILGLCLLLSFNMFGQQLTLSDLENVANKTNWEHVNQYLMNKGWEFFDSEKGSSLEYNTITWSYNKSSYNDAAEGWFHLFNYEGLPNKINYGVFNKASYSIINNFIKLKGYKFAGSKIENNEIIVSYSNSNFILTVTTAKRDKENYTDNSITEYYFTLVKKNGVYDYENGKKTDYYTDGAKQAEYTLKDGEMNGILTVFYPNGLVKKKGNYIDGKENGSFTEYDELGNITANYSMKNGLMNGKLLIYESGKISHSLTFKNGLKNGEEIVYYYSDEGELLLKECREYLDDLKNGEGIDYYYNDEGKLVLKGYCEYLDDKKNGAWETYIIEKEKERLLNLTNYTADVKNGKFLTISGDSVIIGNYQNDKLHGRYKIYRDVVFALSGEGIARTDTNEITLFAEGYYYQGMMTGHWKYYDFTEALISEGQYYDDKKTGEWNYYYSKLADGDGNLLPYAEKLYLIRNFKDGKLNGKEIRYSYLTEEKYPCSKIDTDGTPIDTCTKLVFEQVMEIAHYKNDKLDGVFEMRDSTNQIVMKGYYLNDIPHGEFYIRSSIQDLEGKYYEITEKGSYVKGEKDGQWKEYYENGEIFKSYCYKHGELQGKQYEWSNSGKLTKEKIFVNGIFKSLIVYDTLSNKIESKYEIYDETQNVHRMCRWTQYTEEGYYSQEYSIRIDINHVLLSDIITSLLAIMPVTDRIEVYKDGIFRFYNNDNQILIDGAFFKGEEVGYWDIYYYDQQVRLVLNFDGNSQVNERYYTIGGELYTGEFVFVDENMKEVRKIKDGLRHGKTFFIDQNSGETIKKENYKKGIKK